MLIGSVKEMTREEDMKSFFIVIRRMNKLPNAKILQTQTHLSLDLQSEYLLNNTIFFFFLLNIKLYK